MPIASINPATGETVKTFHEHTDSEIQAKLAEAANTFSEYRHTTFDERAEKMISAAEILRRQRQEEAAKRDDDHRDGQAHKGRHRRS